MSLSASELQQHCNAIIDLAQRKRGIMVLCEGNINEIKGRVEQYRKLEQFPDANFYKACVPTWWLEKRPNFVPCGDRKDVIDTYFELTRITQTQNIQLKHIAFIDLDLQPHVFTDYFAADTEALYKLFYNQGKLQTIEQDQCSIFITGLIYKEAYFLIPELKPLFDNYPTPILFDDTPIDLPQIYIKMANRLTNDRNLTANFQRACNRISHIGALNFSDTAKLQESWLESFHSTERTHQNQLIHALLTIHQVKDYWRAIKPIDNALPQQRFKDQLTLAIGQFYAQQPRDSDHHLPSFFNMLSNNN